MKISIHDIAGQCFPENVDIGDRDELLTERIKQQVFSRLGLERRRRKIVRTSFLIAAALVMLIGSAYALSEFKMSFDSRQNQTISRSFGGIEAQIEDIGAVFTFEGPNVSHRVGFKASYLPAEPDYMTAVVDIDREPVDGWYCDIFCEEGEASDAEILYRIMCTPVCSSTKLFIQGQTELIKQQSLETMELIELHYIQATNFEVNLLLLFDSVNGYMLQIGSEVYGFEELEKIASGMSICVFTENELTQTEDIYASIGLGRG